jgi:arginyl-tRNA--protein-N-Asp/Glu arginylyltransferase
MSYKARFRPLEQLVGNRWQAMPQQAATAA